MNGRPEPGLPPVGVTGVGVAALRAVESARPDRLFEDGCAEALVRAAGLGARLEDPATRHRPIASWVAARTRFLDDVVAKAVAGRVRQAVLLGAGLDTRAFRLHWPEGTRLWELDLPDVLNFKERVVADEGWQTRCARRTLPVDLSGDWRSALLDNGLDPGTPTVWLAEGLLAYLTAETRDTLIGGTAALSAPQSALGLTLASPGRWKSWQERHPDGVGTPGDFVALWQSDAPEDAVAWLCELGWSAGVFDAAERLSSYGRQVDDATRATAKPRLIEATRA